MGFVEPTAGARVQGRPRDGASRRVLATVIGPLAVAARQAADPGQRARLWSTAIELHELAGHGDPSAPPQDRTDLCLALCELAAASAHDGAGRAVRDRALDVAGDDPRLRSRALTCLRAPVLWPLPDPTGTHRIGYLLEVAVTRTFTAEPRARLLVAAVYEPVPGTAPALRYRRACEALDLAHGIGEPELICAALAAVAHTLTGPALLTGWRSLAAEMRRVAEAAGLRDYQALAAYLSFRTACRETDLSTAREHARHALELARGTRLRNQLDILLAFDAVVESLRGDQATAAEDYRELTRRMAESGVAHAGTVGLIVDCALAWGRSDLAVLRDRLASAYAVSAEPIAQLYALVLARAGDHDGAREVFHRHPEPPRQWFRTLNTAFRAHAAIALDEREVAAGLYEALLPCSGTVLGLDTGVAVFGLADELLADLAGLLGDDESARILRSRAEAVRERLRANLETMP